MEKIPGVATTLWCVNVVVVVVGDFMGYCGSTVVVAGAFFFFFFSFDSIMFQWRWWFRWMAFGGWVEFQ